MDKTVTVTLTLSQLESIIAAASKEVDYRSEHISESSAAFMRRALAKLAAAKS